VIAGRFRVCVREIGSNVPSNNPELPQTIPNLLEVLRDPVLDHLGAMPDLAQMRIYPTHHGLGFVSQLARDGVGRDRSALVKRLETGGAVGVAKGLCPDLPLLHAGAEGHPVQ
jgi:hypothetical protein